jgi:hypothetical protein
MPTPFCDADIAKMHRYVAAPLFCIKTGARIPLCLQGLRHNRESEEIFCNFRKRSKLS